MATLERLVYHSIATGRTDSLLTVATLLGQAQHNNTRDEVTGVLVAHADRFLQVLEGPPSAIEALVRRLSVDPRHRDMVILGRTVVPGRLFAWSMASARLTPAIAGLFDDLASLRPLSAERTAVALKAAVAAA